MKTVPTILPIYDSILKQDQNRTGTKMPVLTPRHRLPSLLWNVQSDVPGEIDKIEIIGQSTIDITSYFNHTAAYVQNGGGAGWSNNVAGYDTFTAVNKNITSAIKTTAAGIASSWNMTAFTSVPQLITAGESIRIKAILTLNSGTAPKCVLQNTGTSANISNIVTLTAGTNHIMLTASVTTTGFAITFYNGNGETCNWSAVLSLGEKSVIPRLYTALTDDYFQYKGESLGTPLPRGAWYLKITTANGDIYYSDYFVVTDIYENLITAWVENFTYDTFTSTGTAITSAIEAGADGAARTSVFSVKKGDKIKIITNLTLNGGNEPYFVIRNNTTSAWISNSIQTEIGFNEIELTVLANSDNATLLVYQYAIYPTNFSTTEVHVIKSFSPEFIKIDFHDTHDLGEILYQDGFSQTVFFQQKLAPPTHEVIEVGEEKNGIFVAEKIITKYKYRIIANIGRELYKALIKLPQHDTISITDEVGNEYSPKTGNVQVIPANWIYYDICKIEIVFNDNAEYVWTSENNNIT